MLGTLKDYYSLRAQEYEEIYERDDPVRQAELTSIANAIREVFFDRRVLEVACGTGYWTEVLAGVARHVVTLDASPEMLTIAREKGLPPDKVEFCLGDAYALKSVPGVFDAGLANFWFSHVPKARLAFFLEGFHRRLGAGSIIFMADNVFVPGLGGELVIHPRVKDTFKVRELSDGSKHEVLKNYYDADQLRAILSPASSDLNIQMGSCYWWVRYKTL